MYRGWSCSEKRSCSDCRDEGVDIRTSNLGRQSAEDFHKSRHLLKEEEVEILKWRCDILQRSGFPQSVKDVRDMAEQILRKRDPTETVSPRWIDRFLYKHHLEVKARWSRQLNRIRASHGNNSAALELFLKR